MSKSPTGRFGLARRLLPVAIGVPLVLGWLERAGERAGLYELAFGVALYAAALTVIAGLVGLWNGRSLRLSAQAHAAAEASLRDSEERYRRLTENAYDLIVEAQFRQASLRVLYASPNHKDALGYDPGELVGRSELELVHPEDLPAVRAALANEYGQAVFRVRHKCGEWRWVEGTGRVFRTATGERRTVIISRDITARKRAEEQRAQLEERLRHVQRLDAVGRLAGGIAHDFNRVRLFWNDIKSREVDDPFSCFTTL